MERVGAAEAKAAAVSAALEARMAAEAAAEDARVAAEAAREGLRLAREAREGLRAARREDLRRRVVAEAEVEMWRSWWAEVDLEAEIGCRSRQSP